MNINEFKLERYFAKHEFKAKYLLSISDCDGYSLQDVLSKASNNEISLWENLKLGYTESEGNPLLRTAIGQYYKNITNDNIVVASPGELNFIVMNVLLKPTDHVISIQPSYQSLYEVVKSIGCELSYWKPTKDNWHFNTNDLQKLIKTNTKLIVINFPHNPTGSYLQKSELDEIVEIARANNCYIFSDEMYHKLVLSEMDELQPISDLYEKGISLWGTSKTFGLAGLRIGWIVSQNTELLHKVLAFKDYLSICNSATSEILSLIALNNMGDFVPQNIAKIKKNIALFTAFSKKHSSIIEFIPPKAGSTSFVKLFSKETSLEFCNNLVEKTGIMAVPSEMFGFEGKYIRIGFGRENIPEVLNEFDKFLSNY